MLRIANKVMHLNEEDICNTESSVMLAEDSDERVFPFCNSLFRVQP